MKPEEVDYSVYLVTDRGLSRGRGTLDIVAAAVTGGASVVQLREKSANTREFIQEALQLKAYLNKMGVPLIINDRLDVAQAIRADGVHLGQHDMPIEMARAIVGHRMIIGISAESLRDAVDAEEAGADYLGVSPIFATPTKTDTAPALGLEGLRQIRRAVAIPLVGIGGLNRTNAQEVIAAGADGVAVVSAIVSADNPESAARELRRIVAKSR
ncbi:Thiamin-phosphate pyrophosphorylase (EC [Olavius algarvensis associated proteobacterium Delta 3]|nr:Thiamin-phosphate pyrophosphorylase (EC [Olavius algarvensis associated proteobacterium Delta 3]CAB5149528.1 Thiamin-phosphate pyrophosphorylase (EC [Olavius algarvensis associated proteobacterium Delta 3]